MALAVVVVALGACGDDAASNAPPSPPLSARIELDTDTVTIGGMIDGRVVVSNNTGENIEVTGCGSLFQVGLANEEYEQMLAFTQCVEPFTIRTGESSYPVTVVADHGGCEGGPPPHPAGVPVCDSPFPPGDYEARLYQGYNGRQIPDPPPAHVRVETDP